MSNNISNVLLKVQATDRAKLMLMALKARLRQKTLGDASGAWRSLDVEYWGVASAS